MLFTQVIYLLNIIDSSEGTDNYDSDKDKLYVPSKLNQSINKKGKYFMLNRTWEIVTIHSFCIKHSIIYTYFYDKQIKWKIKDIIGIHLLKLLLPSKELENKIWIRCTYIPKLLKQTKYYMSLINYIKKPIYYIN